MKKIKNWISNSFRYRKVLQETYEWDYYPIMKFTKKHLEYLLINTQEFEEADEKRMIKEYYIKRCLLISNEKTVQKMRNRDGGGQKSSSSALTAPAPGVEDACGGSTKGFVLKVQQ